MAADADIEIVRRWQWGAKPPTEDLTIDSWKPWLGGVIIHHKGFTDVWDPAEDHKDCPGQIREVQDDKMSTGYSDIPYNYVVCQHGVIFEGRGGDVRSAANGTQTTGANQNYFAIMGMVGTLWSWPGEGPAGDWPTEAMRDSIRNLVGYVRQYGSAGLEIKGHLDVYDTECPGMLQRFVEAGSFEPPTSRPPIAQPVKIIPRWQWGARPPREVTPVSLSARTGFTVHYTDSPTITPVRSIQNYHMDTNGWWDIGYNFLVDVDGRIYEGRGWDLVGAHASGHNETHIGVAFIGRDGFATAKALRSIRALYERANVLTGKTLAKTYHSGLSGNYTLCPGDQLRTWVQNGMNADDLPELDDPPPSGGGMGGGMVSVRSVASQQQAVNDAGYSPMLAVDGIWGPNTNTGVRWLQGELGVAVDGLWGPNTEAAYQAQIGGSAPGGGMASVRTVASQQRAVNTLGYSPKLDVDGFWGPNTDAGVRWLQGKLGVTVDGLWGPNTEAAYQAYYDEGALLVVDGDFGPATIRATQRAIGTTVDGQWGLGSVRALQRHLNTWSDAGLEVDGDMGPGTIKALQRHLNTMISAGLDVDGIWGYATIAAMQKALNRARF